MGSSDLGGGGVTMPLKQPVPVELLLELEQRLALLLNGVEDPHPQQLPLQGVSRSAGMSGMSSYNIHP